MTYETGVRSCMLDRVNGLLNDSKPAEFANLAMRISVILTCAFAVGYLS